MAASEEYDLHILTSNNKEITLNVEPSKTVQEVMTTIQQQAGIAINRQVLLFNDRPLDCAKTLREYEIYNGACLNMTFSRTGTA